MAAKNLRLLSWISISFTVVNGYEIEEFIDTTGNYFKRVFNDDYEEIKDLHTIQTGQTIKDIKTPSKMPAYKVKKACYNININKRS